MCVTCFLIVMTPRQKSTELRCRKNMGTVTAWSNRNVYFQTLRVWAWIKRG